MKGIHADDLADAGPVQPDNDRDLLLLSRVATGDRQAFQDFYFIYHRRLARFLTRLTRRYDVAEEVINDTLWVVWCKAPQFRAESKVSTWVMGIAYRRALKTLQQLRVSLPGTLDPSEAAGLATEGPHARAERQQWLELALDQLSLDHRMTLELTYYLGYSCEEVATIMDCPVNTVKTRMFHARRKLKALLPHLAGSRGETDA